jgi:hypothetical protein
MSKQESHRCQRGHGGFAAEYDIEREFRETRLQAAPISTRLILALTGEHLLDSAETLFNASMLPSHKRYAGNIDSATAAAVLLSAGFADDDLIPACCVRITAAPARQMTTTRPIERGSLPTLSSTGVTT